WDYWGKPVPSFGDPEARLFVIGLAPAAHGGNRTGRVFTGDSSGDWLFRALHKAGFANQAVSRHRGDGLELRDCYISAVIHCAPPDNKPLPNEIANCRDYLDAELRALENVRVIVALGRIAFENFLKHVPIAATPRPQFSHGAIFAIDDSKTLIASYHPSRQNTNTGKLTEPMLDSIFMKARELLLDRPVKIFDTRAPSQ
ncbi:MAG: uracil-DNA glycosylase, partial [Verrucomicrobiota bacterium]|nr:uracil-DNA glycosylase [Verrucomicrobiota bacterium]